VLPIIVRHYVINMLIQCHFRNEPYMFQASNPKVRGPVCCSHALSRPEKIPCLRCTKTRATGPFFSYMGNRRIYVRSQAAGVGCASYIGEANRMWSAVCSLTSTADRLPGEKMMPGGGVMPSRAGIMGQSASGQRDRNLRSTLVFSGPKVQARIQVL
jgi:hypothetical protein